MNALKRGASIVTGRFTLLFLKWLPFLALAAYAVLLVDYYCQYLDEGLKYISPELPSAPEDILGLGFWPPWLVATVPFALACALSYRLGRQEGPGYWALLLCVFGVLSVADYGLYVVLERQVLI